MVHGGVDVVYGYHVVVVYCVYINIFKDNKFTQRLHFLLSLCYILGVNLLQYQLTKQSVATTVSLLFNWYAPNGALCSYFDTQLRYNT